MTGVPISPRDHCIIASNKAAIFNSQIISFDHFSTESNWANTKVTEKFLTVLIVWKYLQIYLIDLQSMPKP